MGNVNYTTVENALKRDYLPELQKQIEKKVKTWDLLSKSSEGIKGRDLYIKNFESFPQGVGPAAAEAALPTPGSAGYAESKISVKRNYATIQFDAMLESESNAVVDIIDFEMQAAEESLQKELNFQLAYGDGTSKRAQVKTAIAAGTTTVEVETVDGRPGTDFLYKNMYIDIAGATPVNNQITAVNPSAGTITVATTITAAAEHAAITRENSTNLSMMGIPGIVKDSGVLQNLDPATYPWWAAKKTDLSAKWGTSDASFLDNIQAMVDDVHYNSTGKVNLIYGWPLFKRQYRYAMEAKRRIVNTLDFKEGRTGLAYVTEDGDIAILDDWYLPWYSVFFLDTSKFSIRTLKGIHWEEKDGTILRFLERKDVITAWLKLYAEFITTSRNCHGYWTNTGTTVGDYS